jgi:hypothetical protein
MLLAFIVAAVVAVYFLLETDFVAPVVQDKEVKPAPKADPAPVAPPAPKVEHKVHKATHKVKADHKPVVAPVTEKPKKGYRTKK